MRMVVAIFVITAVAGSTLHAQPPASAPAAPKFEVASIEPHPAGDSFGGTGVSPGMMNVRNPPVRRLIRNAYKAPTFRSPALRTGSTPRGSISLQKLRASFAATECY
jgi:hypothetical protein